MRSCCFINIQMACGKTSEPISLVFVLFISSYCAPWILPTVASYLEIRPFLIPHWGHLQKLQQPRVEQREESEIFKGEGKSRCLHIMNRLITHHFFHVRQLPSYVRSEPSRVTCWRWALRGILCCLCSRWSREALWDCDSPDAAGDSSSAVGLVFTTSNQLQLVKGHSTARLLDYMKTTVKNPTGNQL